MDKEQRERMAERTIVEEIDEREMPLTVRVSGNVVELSLQQEMPWDNEDGTGNDEDVKTWTMSLETFKRLLKAGQWCVEKSEAFEKAHPAQASGEQAPGDNTDLFLDSDETLP